MTTTNKPSARIPLRAVELVDESYARLTPLLEGVASAFWERVDAATPSLERIFPVSDTDKRDVALSVFRFIIQNLRSTETLSRLLEKMGGRGLLRGVSSAEVDVVGKALLTSLRDYDRAWDLETAHGWAVAYTWTLAAVRRGARTSDDAPELR